MVEKKKVFINGKLAVLGSQVNEFDTVKIKGDKNLKPYIYFAYNKPVGVITHSPQKKEYDIKQNITGIKSKNKLRIHSELITSTFYCDKSQDNYLMLAPRLGDVKTKFSHHPRSTSLIKTNNIPKDVLNSIFPIGRLDKNSHGLIILTNDGRITDQLLNPKYFHEKEYIVKTLNKLRSNFKQKMENGVNIEGYVTKKSKVNIIDNFTFRVILTEGKKHQIRRMCSALFQEVIDLKRVRIMNIKLGNLRPNALREIKSEELYIFLNSVFI